MLEILRVTFMKKTMIFAAVAVIISVIASLLVLQNYYIVDRIVTDDAHSISETSSLPQPRDGARDARADSAKIKQQDIREKLQEVMNEYDNAAIIKRMRSVNDAELIRILVDDDESVYRRSAAARALGAKKSFHGLSFLIDRITQRGCGPVIPRKSKYFADNSGGLTSGFYSSTYGFGLVLEYPCVDALFEFGWTCVPALVREYGRIIDSPTDEDETARGLLTDVIILQGNTHIAIGIASFTLVFTKTDTKSKRAYFTLIHELLDVNNSLLKSMSRWKD